MENKCIRKIQDARILSFFANIGVKVEYIADNFYIIHSELLMKSTLISVGKDYVRNTPFELIYQETPSNTYECSVEIDIENSMYTNTFELKLLACDGDIKQFEAAELFQDFLRKHNISTVTDIKVKEIK